MNMRKNSSKKSIAPVLDDLLNDGRLERLFSTDARHCALQLWILQIKSEQSIENRVVYGRLLPYSHSSDSWSATNDDEFHHFGGVQAQVVRLNLYVKSVYCAELLRQLSAGWTILAISEKLGLGLSSKLKARFGATSLTADDLVYRPVAYLLNRDAHDQHSPTSPHGEAGAFSASIIQIKKRALFCIGHNYDVAMTASVIKHLNMETGLDFSVTDTTRFGDIELLVFPTLDDLERSLLKVSWVDDPRALIARFNPMQVPNFTGFQFRLSIANDGQLVYCGIATAERDAEGVFECKFEINDQLRARTDSTDLEIFGLHGDHPRGGTLCCRWRMGYVREAHFQIHAVGNGVSPVKFDWLERTTRPSVSARVKAALTINRGNSGFTNQIGGREADPWVPANRDLTSLFSRLHPQKSQGWFFQRWGPSDGEGRLQFVEWFKSLLLRYQQHQIVIFDPYFEAAGLGLLLLSAVEQTDYIVFTSLPKPTREGKLSRRKSDKAGQARINNLLANCEQNRHLQKSVKLRVYGLKEGRLHDRYILMMGPDNLPAAGFNLSNSFQNATENYPLLVTPIPADTLLKVEQYKADLVREAEVAQFEEDTENPSMRLLFSSATSPTAQRHYEPLSFLEKTQAGDVLSIWADEPSLKGLCGDPLKELMAALSLLRDDSLVLPETAGLLNCIHRQAGDYSDFTATWEILGEMLAHSPAGDCSFPELESQYGFLEFLTQFLNASFTRAHDEVGKELTVADPWFFGAQLGSLLHSSFHAHHLFHPTKYGALTWPEHFTIRFLWWYAPDALLAIAETQMGDMPMEHQGTDLMRLSLLGQIVSEISLSIQVNISPTQRDRLVCSGNGLLKWMGLNAIERQLEEPEGLSSVLQVVATFPAPEKVLTFGWMINRLAMNSNKAEIYEGLVVALHEALPAKITADELRQLVDTMRGHMQQLSWAEPWLFKDVVFPLLQNERATTDDACGIWIQELAAMLGPELKHRSRLFSRAREGQTTNITAFLFAYSSPQQQQACLKSIRAILQFQRRIVQQPLASTSDWARWDDALMVSMWILTFARWSQYYLRERGMTERVLEELSRGASDLSMVRPIGEWRSDGTGTQGELATFLDQVEGLLASN